MNNPFESIESRLCNIESLILDLKHQPKTIQENQREQPSTDQEQPIALLSHKKKVLCNKNNHSNASACHHGGLTNNDYAKRLFEILYEKPLSRRMAATRLGFHDQTYMVTQLIYDWIKEDKAYPPDQLHLQLPRKEFV